MDTYNKLMQIMNERTNKIPLGTNPPQNANVPRGKSGEKLIPKVVHPQIL